MSRTEMKMVIVMRKDLNMTKGKYVAQGSHAAVSLVLDLQNSDNPSHKFILDTWLSNSFTKIGLVVHSEEELIEIYYKAKALDVPSTLIVDNGWTMFKGIPTRTCVSILGESDLVDRITGHLKLL